jgi:predicted MPP superfamily phosphohydrolase
LTRVLGFALFVSIAFAIVAGVHYYFWVRLVRDTQLSGAPRLVATWMVVTLAVLIPATMVLGRAVPAVGRILAWPGFVWMGAMFILFVLLLGGDVMRLLVAVVTRLLGDPHAFDPGRRLLVARLVGGAALTSMAALTSAAVWATRSQLNVKRLELTLDRLPVSLDGTKIVQLCDLHVGGLLSRPFIEKVVATTNRLDADLIAIVGDLVDGTIEDLRPVLAPMRSLRARHGAFFVTGNHEYYQRSGARAWMNEIESMGIRVLDNQRVSIGGPEDSFDLAGVPDHGAAHFPEEGKPSSVAEALAGRDPSRAVVLLAHQPKSIFQAAPLGVDLQLSGHTHGGQIWPWGALVRLQQPFIRGLHRVDRTQLYVSCGTGFWGPPMRLGAPAEITQIVLRAKRAAT